MTFQPPTFAPVWLASRSPRRAQLLREAGVAVQVEPAGIDDGRLSPGSVSPQQWVMALAYLKARWVAEALARAGRRSGTVLAADTVCVHDGRIFGQPSDAAAARGMLRSMRDATHETMSGVCLISLADQQRWLFVDRATVRIGHVTDDELDAYLAGGEWRGKAGGYNLQDRLAAGWPIVCDGDPATVMGLPMRRLTPWLQQIRNGQAS